MCYDCNRGPTLEERMEHKFPESKDIGLVDGPDGQRYSCEFYGEDEGAAVIVGPLPFNTGEIQQIPEVHREDATDVNDARAKLAAWRKANGWPEGEPREGRVLWREPPRQPSK